MKNINDKIDKLPPLSLNIKEMKYLIYNEDYNLEKLLNIIENDSFLRTRILKHSNKGFFSFESVIDTPSRALHLYGMNFSLSLIIFYALRNMLKPDLFAYDFSNKKHENLSEISCLLLLTWIGKKDIDLEERLLMPLLLSELGRFIISESIMEKDLKESVTKLLKEGILIEKIEKEFLSTSCSEVSSLILDKWSFDKELVSKVKDIDNLKVCEKNKDIAILNVLKTVCCIHSPFSVGNIRRAIEKAKNFGLDYKTLEESILIVSKRIKEEKQR